jgi:hypothetical protein
LNEKRWGSGELGAGIWEQGARSKELGAGSWELGAGSWEQGAGSEGLGARGWELKLEQPPHKKKLQKKGSLKRLGFCRILCRKTYLPQFINATDYWHFHTYLSRFPNLRIFSGL